MSKMTPEQEASYAIQYNMSRDGLKPAVQVEYDRLLKAQQAAGALRREATVVSRRAAAEAAAQIAAKKKRLIPVSTTESLPPSLGGDYEIKKIKLVKFWGYETPEDAEKALISWVQLNDYDAVTGVRFIGIPNVIGSTVPNGLASATRTEIDWMVYGTAVRWT